MIRYLLSLIVGVSIAGIPLLSGCEREIEYKKEVEVKDDGTVKKEEKRVTEQPDGTIKKEETKSVDRP